MRCDPDRVGGIDDPRVASYRSLTDMALRQRVEVEQGFFMAEGHLVIARCAELGLRFESVLTAPRWLDRMEVILAGTDVDVLVADDALLRDITGYRVHRGALAVVERPPRPSVADIVAGHGDILVLEDLVDPTNVGLAIRSAVVQGIDRVIVSTGCADPLYRKAVKASMGAVLRCRWARSDDWEETVQLIARERRLVALTPRADRDIADILREVGDSGVALAFGSEGPGLSDRVLDHAWRRCAIPMTSDHDSLNVAAAVAVAVYARSRSITP